MVAGSGCGCSCRLLSRSSCGCRLAGRPSRSGDQSPQRYKLSSHQSDQFLVDSHQIQQALSRCCPGPSPPLTIGGCDRWAGQFLCSAGAGMVYLASTPSEPFFSSNPTRICCFLLINKAGFQVDKDFEVFH